MLVIYFSHLCKVYWWFVMSVNYHQQASPTLRLLLVLDKRVDYSRHNLRTKHQHKTIPSHTCMWDSKCLPWNFGRLKNGTAWNISPSSFSQVNWRNIFGFLKTKHGLPSPFVVLSNHFVFVVFLDPHQGIDDFAFFLSTSKNLCGAQVGINVRTYLHCIYCKVKTMIQGENVILLDQDVHVCGYVYGG